MKARVCPKCGKRPVSFTEFWAGHTIVFDPDENGEPVDEGWMGDDSYPTHVVSTCSCGHKWRLRGVDQIIDLRSDPL